MSGLFVLIWATGFVVVRYAAPHAEQLTFLVIRYLGVVAVMALLAALFRAPWPADRRGWRTSRWPASASRLGFAGVGLVVSASVSTSGLVWPRC